MTWVGARHLLRRLRPATIRMRLALLAAVITFVPLTAAAIPVARTERTAQMQNADRKAAKMNSAIDTMINSLHGGNPLTALGRFSRHKNPSTRTSVCADLRRRRVKVRGSCH